MAERRITVWVQRFKDRTHLMLQWIDPDTGKRKSKSAETDDPDRAEDKRADLEYELNNGLHKEASRMSWERFRELFEQEYVSGLRPCTRDNYEDTLDQFEQLCRPASLRGINERTVSRFVGALREVPTRRGVGQQPSTIKVRLQFLHTALQWAADQKLIPTVPHFPSVKVPKRRPQPIPLESFERLLGKAPDDNMRAYLLTGWLAGLRLREAALLDWEPTADAPYLDLARDRIILPAEFVKATEDQWVPLDPQLQAVLEALPRHGRKVFRFVGRDRHPICIAAISHQVTRLAKKAGVKLTMHALRKGFGCRYAGKVPAQVLQRLMRHSSIKTTMEFYANVDEAVEAAVLGDKRNRSRNNPAPDPTTSNPVADATNDPTADKHRS